MFLITFDIAFSTLIRQLGKSFLCASISLSCCFGPETAYDAYIPDVRRALQLAESLHLGGPSSRSARPASITSSILILSLYNVALKCRDGAIRRKAVSMLEGYAETTGDLGGCLCVQDCESGS